MNKMRVILLISCYIMNKMNVAISVNPELLHLASNKINKLTLRLYVIDSSLTI